MIKKINLRSKCWLSVVVAFWCQAQAFPAEPIKITSSTLTKRSIPLFQEITGTVKDEKNQPIPGATIRIKGTTIGVQTDLDGKYKINVNPGQVLVFSTIGFESKEITVGATSVISVTLNSASSSLSEVVVNGYSTQRRSAVTAAISTVSGQDLLKA